MITVAQPGTHIGHTLSNTLTSPAGVVMITEGHRTRRIRSHHIITRVKTHTILPRRRVTPLRYSFIYRERVGLFCEAKVSFWKPVCFFIMPVFKTWKWKLFFMRQRMKRGKIRLLQYVVVF